jgi:hypothetical protein
VDYEREKGRIAGHRTKRLRAVEFARSMISILAHARKKVPDRNGQGASNLALANWLNANNYKTIKGKVWRSETVSRLFDCHIGWITEIEAEYRLSSAVRAAVLRQRDVNTREQRLQFIGDIEAIREMNFKEARKLAADLSGKPYREEPVPPAIGAVFPQSRSEVKERETTHRIRPAVMNIRRRRVRQETHLSLPLWDNQIASDFPTSSKSRKTD